MIKRSFFYVVLTLLWYCISNVNASTAYRIPQLLSFSPNGGFCLADGSQLATLCVDKNDHIAVRRAVDELACDLKRVTGHQPVTAFKARAHSVVIGTIGHSALIDRMVKQKQLDVQAIKGQWESFLIATVGNQLVIAGSDRRGTIFGIYELSRQMGVSPWYWWADVPVRKHSQLYVREGCFVESSPSVKYRGIFINDEDWGLKPWATTNYEKVLGDIGPRTYARVCELLLRLRANMLAPAMHSCTGAFYSHVDSKRVADSLGIIITTSHCEPLLLNNAAKSEWDVERDGEWNFKTNRSTILRKWDNRLSEASQYENIYTVAMRGLHDEGLRGNLPMNERVPLLDTVITLQRKMLEQHIGQSATQIPQIFVPYKETMDIYEAGLHVPDDITLVWVDDNYGYMKRVSNAKERQRKGGSGVYYHLSYLGAPHDYLWLNTTPPVLMYEELMKAYHTGADRYWLLNVGDIKPMELGIQTFMQLAWNPSAFSIESINRYQAEWLAKELGFDAAKAEKLQSLLDDYYRLAWSRKPEYMGFEYEWDDKAHTGLKSTDFSFQHYAEAQQRLADYQRIANEAEQLSNGTAACFELLQFPVQAAYQMNRKFLMAQLNKELLAQGLTAQANWAARQMQVSYDSIETLNRRYNSQMNGKWMGMMTLPPGFCALYHQKPEVVYTEGAGEEPVDLTPRPQPAEGCMVINLSNYQSKSNGVQLIKGLGYDWTVVQLQEGSISYALPTLPTDTIEVRFWAVPFWPLYKGLSNRISISIDGGTPQVFENHFAEYSRSWKDQVMRNGIECRMRFAIDRLRSSHTITFTTLDPGQMLQRLTIDWGGLLPSYIGPKI